MSTNKMSKREGAEGPLGWNVEAALQEVVDSIAWGSRLTLPGEVIEGYKDRYRPDFQRVSTTTGWQEDKERVLALATLVGALAATLTMLKQVRNGKDIPVKLQLDPESAYAAAYVIAKSGICHAGMLSSSAGKSAAGSAVPKGAYCTNFPVTALGETQPDIAKALAQPLAGIKDLFSAVTNLD